MSANWFRAADWSVTRTEGPDASPFIASNGRPGAGVEPAKRAVAAALLPRRDAPPLAIATGFLAASLAT